MLDNQLLGRADVMATAKNEQLVKELSEKLTAKIAEITVDDWRGMFANNLEMNIWKYSPRNQMILWAQGATTVAGFRAWRKEGRKVRKGAKAVHILAPMVGKEKVEQENGTMVEEDRVFGFKTVPVFDIFATERLDGVDDTEELRSEFSKGVRSIEHNHASAVKSDLLVWLNSLGNVQVSFDYHELKGTENGFHRENALTDSSLIVVDGRMSEGAQLRTLAHEIGHMLMHRGIKDYQNRRALYELEAETFAYIALSMLGIEADEFTEASAGYIASWQGENKEKEITEAFTRVSKNVYPMIEQITKKETTEKKVA